MLSYSPVSRWLKSKTLRLVPIAAAALIHWWGKSFFAIKVVNGDFEAERAATGQGCVYVTWHQRLFNLYFLHHRRPLTIMISRSKDGELATGAVHRLGFATVRGSSSRGGATAMYQLIEAMQNEPSTCAGMLGDGPKGPARKLKLGTLKIAQATGAPILPFAYSAKRHKLFVSWDRFMLPLPFSPLVVIFGEPLIVPSQASDKEFEELRLKVENSLNELTERCDLWWRNR